MASDGVQSHQASQWWAKRSQLSALLHREWRRHGRILRGRWRRLHDESQYHKRGYVHRRQRYDCRNGSIAFVGQVANPRLSPGQPVTYTTTNAGAGGGTVFGQGSYNNGGPFHVGNKVDKHNNGFDADGNPINSLHIDTGANFYKNQVEDGPLRFEETYQQGQDAPIVVPVHLGWTGQDWAWWSTSYFYNPDPTPTPKPYPYPYPYPGPSYPNIPTPDSPTVPTIGYPTITDNPVPTGGSPGIDIPTAGTPNTGYVPVVSGGPIAPPTPTGTNGGDVTGGGMTGGGDGGGTAGDVPKLPGTGTVGTSSWTADGFDPITPMDPGVNDPSAGDQGHLFDNDPSAGADPPGGFGPKGGGGKPSKPSKSNKSKKPPTGPPRPVSRPNIPIHVVPDIPILQDIVGSYSGPAMNLISSTSAVASQATQFTAQNYNPNSAATGIFNGALASQAGGAASALNKGNNSDPLCGAASSFASQGGNIAPSPAPSLSPSFSPSPAPTPTPSPAPSTTTGGKGDPWNYTQTPRDTTDTGKQRSKYKKGTASGGICYHPSETDLRDIPVGLVPPNTTMSTTTVTVGPNAFFAAGVPELVNGSIKSGYRWGVDTSTGDLVFYSISFSQSPIEAVRFCNAGQVIRWRSTENVYGELSHANTGNQRYSFPDTTGTVIVGTNVIADGAGSLLLNGHTGGSGPVSTTPKLVKMRASDGQDYWFEGYQ